VGLVVLAAIAVWRSGTLARWSAVPLAAGFALFVPQFFGPPALRIAHGALIAIGGVWLGLELWRAPTGGSSPMTNGTAGRLPVRPATG
jgi:hypothetical protein